MTLSDRIRPGVEAAPWVIEEVKKMENALHRISLASQNSMSSQRECGRIARKALKIKIDAERPSLGGIHVR